MGTLEQYNLEYKVEVNNTFLKTVSAYANYGDGAIVFGIADSGEIVGLENLDDICLSIENKINDNIKPIPDYQITVNKSNHTVQLNVLEGQHKPYLYKSKAYRRADTSTVEIDRIELNRLILQGSNLSFEELPAFNDKLTFNYLEKELIRQLDVEKLNDDILKTLDLYADKLHYNRVAELLSDNSSFPGIDIIRFGKSIDEILDRETYEKMSVLEMFENTMILFDKYYCYEKIVGAERIQLERIPKESFREALANAIVHRTWDVKAAIRILMYEESIEIVSPGGLPHGLSIEEYLNGQISLLRNPILGNLFFRLRYIERFGTGIARIIKSYKGAIIQPDFKIYENSITIVLPFYIEDDSMLSFDERTIFKALKTRKELSRKEIEEYTQFNKDKVIRILNQLIEKNAVKKVGSGRNTRYSRTE